MWKWIILFVILVTFVRIKKRGFFWKARNGDPLTFKQFLSRFKQGVEGINPLQQTKTTLWSFVPIICGTLWGVAVTFIGGVYWMSLILVFSLPIQIVQIISNYQKYSRLKKVYGLMNELKTKEKNFEKKKNRKKTHKRIKRKDK